MKIRNTKKTKKAKDENQEKEMMNILAKSDQVKGEQLTINDEGELHREKELKLYAIGNIDSPDKKYEVYYNGIMRLLRKHLPSGYKNKKAREFIYEEKNTFLTRGKRKNKFGIRGADSRMGYLVDAKEILKIVIKWITSNGTSLELFMTIRDVNVSKGYGAPKH